MDRLLPVSDENIFAVDIQMDSILLIDFSQDGGQIDATAISNFAAHTIFHKTRKPLRDWFWAIFLVATRTTGSSANHTTLWSLLLGWGFGSFGLLHGIKSGLLLGPLVAIILVFFHLLIALALSGKRD